MNQTLIKSLIKGANGFITAQQEPESKLYYQEKGHFLIGGAVDTHISQGVEAFEEIYFTEDGTQKPKSEVIKSIVKRGFDILKDNLEGQDINKLIVSQLHTFPAWRQIMYDSCNEHEYYNNRKKASWEDDTRYETIKKDNLEGYVTSLVKAQGKTILSEEESAIASNIIMSFTTHRHTAKYFTDRKDVTIYYQVPIYFEFQGIQCKALLDMVIVDHTNKTIQVIDMKTTANSLLWFNNVIKQFRYDIQAAWYIEAIKLWIAQNPELKDYRLLPFKFIAECTTVGCQGTPIVFTCGNSLMKQGIYGMEETYAPLFSSDNGQIMGRVIHYKTKGILELIDDYKWYNINGFDKNRDIPDSGEFIVESNKMIAV